MFNTWTKAQTNMWEAYTESIANFGKSPGQQFWDQTIEAGQELVKTSLANQAEWLKTWAENFRSMEGMPEGSNVALDQFQEMVERWATTQENLWAAWFDMLKKFDPSQFGGTWANIPKDPFKAWQENTKQVMDTQMEWTRAWMDQFKSEKED
jgi:hypothetical protein